MKKKERKKWKENNGHGEEERGSNLGREKCKRVERDERGRM